MASTFRVYYVGEGEQLEGSEDGGKSWGTYTRCKVVDYGGNSYVWAPPGKTWSWKKLSLKHPYLVSVQNDRPMLQKNRSVAVVDGESVKMDSYLDLSSDEAKAAFREVDREGLMLEAEYNARLQPEELRRKAALLLEQAEAKETESDTLAAKKTKARKSA